MKYGEEHLYVAPVEVWDATRCARAAKTHGSDGMGTPHAFPGYQPYLPTTVRYNGGCVIRDVWYQGIKYANPVLAAGYSWVSVCSWGWRIVANPA